MTNARELLARLNPQTIRYNIGRGGVAELTNQDIAGALAFVPAGLGREVLEACWWPGGAVLRRKHLRDAVVALVMPEIVRQSQRLGQAHLDLQLAEAAQAWSGAASSGHQASVDRQRAQLEAVRAACWPRNMLESLPTLCTAAISEMTRGGFCESCSGRGTVLVGELMTPCKSCAGRGWVAVSDRQRAKAIGRDEAAYRRHWRAPYVWLLDRMVEAEQIAATQLSDALRKEAA